MNRFRAPLLTSVVLVGVLGLVSAQSDPEGGTWKLNTAKSRYTPGPAPKSQTVTITAAGNGITVTSTGTDSAGRPINTTYTVNYDGKDMPVKGSPSYDMTSLKRVNATTTELARKKQGQLVQTTRRVVSADGNTMTVTTTSENEQGIKVNNIGVFEKQ
jgi:hypothetical protein